MKNVTPFSARRKKLLAQAGQDSAVVLFAQTELLRNGDAHFPFRQNSDFYYLTGLCEPNAIAVFVPGRKEGAFILFVAPKDPQIERWQGPRLGPVGACDLYGADQAFSLEQLDTKILELFANRKQIYYPLGKNKHWDDQVLTWFGALQQKARKNNGFPAQLSDITLITDEMRLIKDDTEIQLCRQAAQLSAQAHRAAMLACRPGRYEYELEATIQYELGLRGCRSLAYSSIVGGGKNACVLHYVANNDRLQDGDLVLIDAGGEVDCYAADITRTFPVNGKFTEDQAAIYNIVLTAQLAVIAAIRPGLAWNKLQEIAVEQLVLGLKSVGILSGSVSDIIKNKDYESYFMHGIGHWLGLDVHDAGVYKINDTSRPLKAGMVLTVEPGLYLSPNDNLDKRWWHIGVRIEDDVLVTATGCEVLSAEAPKDIVAIEQLMASSGE